MDYVATALWVGGFGALLAITAGGLIAYANRESETIVLGFAAVAGTVVLFGIQLFFNLGGTTVEEAVGTQIIINRTAPAANALQPANKVRTDGERAAAEWLAAKSPKVFTDTGKLARDLLAFSILNYFATDEPDWRMKRVSYSFPAFGRNSSMTEFHSQSGENAYSLSEADIRRTLHVANNVFAEAPLKIPPVGLRLPPGSRLSMFHAAPPAQQTTLILENPITRIDFVITPTFASEGLRPPTRGQKGFALGQAALAGLPDAEYSLYLMKVLVRASFAGTRAHNPDLGRHREWVERIKQGLGNGFRSEQRP
jgi:hypothetical protein